MDGLILILLVALVAAWLFNRFARMLGLARTRKAYLTVSAVVIIGILVLYANAQG